MTGLKSFNAFINRAATLFTDVQPVYGQYAAATTATLFTGQEAAVQRCPQTRATPNPLQTGVTSYLPVAIGMTSNVNAPILIAKQVLLGTFTFGTGFTAGSTMPTQTVGNTSYVTNGIIMAEVTTVLGGTAGTLTITYTNQAGTGSQSTGAITVTNSAAVGTCGPIVLASSDYGAQSISNITNAGGSSPTGVMKFWGLLPMCIMMNTIVQNGPMAVRNFLTDMIPPIKLGAGDQIGFFLMDRNIKANTGHVFYIGDS